MLEAFAEGKFFVEAPLFVHDGTEFEGVADFAELAKAIGRKNDVGPRVMRLDSGSECRELAVGLEAAGLEEIDHSEGWVLGIAAAGQVACGEGGVANLAAGEAEFVGQRGGVHIGVGGAVECFLPEEQAIGIGGDGEFDADEGRQVGDIGGLPEKFAGEKYDAAEFRQGFDEGDEAAALFGEE